MLCGVPHSVPVWGFSDVGWFVVALRTDPRWAAESVASRSGITYGIKQRKFFQSNKLGEFLDPPSPATIR